MKLYEAPDTDNFVAIEQFVAEKIELNRKLRLLAKAYSAAAGTRHLSSQIRKAHTHMFALNLNDLSFSKSRSGLVVCEKLLATLSLNVTEDKWRENLKSRAAVAMWADHAHKEWKMANPRAEPGPGRWWVLPVLYEYIGEPNSTVRSAIIGLEAMGLVEGKLAYSRPNPKSRAKAIRLTVAGERFLQKLAQPITK